MKRADFWGQHIAANLWLILMEKIIKLINEIKIETSPLKKEALLLYLPKYIEDIL